MPMIMKKSLKYNNVFYFILFLCLCDYRQIYCGIISVPKMHQAGVDFFSLCDTRICRDLGTVCSASSKSTSTAITNKIL